MSRKFSDSEIRAYSKNRYEDKLLRQRLEKLKEGASVFHDASAKQKQDLVAECKDIRMTTGESQAPVGVVTDTEFDISKRVTRPWAYSVMETTHNAVYRDAVIPFPKQSRRKSRSKSGMSRSLVSRCSVYSNRVMSSKSHSPSMKSSMTTRSETTLQRLAPPSINRSVSNPEISRNQLMNITIKIDDTFANENKCNETDKVITFAVENKRKFGENSNESTGTTDPAEGVDIETFNGPNHDNESTHTEILKIDDLKESANGFTFIKEHKRDTRVIILPPVYKIDSKAYQDAERERTITRSRSRVSFSDMTGIQESRDQRAQKPKTPTETKRPSSDTRNAEKDTEYYLNDKGNGETHLRENQNERKETAIHTIDPESLVDVNVRKHDDIVYRGRRLKNYIKPEDRYKLDPLVMKRRQNKMDKLAKESATFLKRVNHENIRVEIAFPRSARKRILTKLVQENNSSQNKVVKDNNEPVIQQKIQYFMTSMSEYIHQQQTEREQYFI